MVSAEQLSSIVGHPEKIKAVAEQCLGYGFKTISRWRGHRRYDELVSEMQWTILRVLNRVADGQVQNPTMTILGQTIYKQSIKLLTRDGVVSVSSTTALKSNARRTMANGETLPDFIDGHGNQFELHDLAELVASCFGNKRETMIFGHYLMGFNDKEIVDLLGEELGLRTSARVQQIRSAVCTKIKKRLQDQNH